MLSPSTQSAIIWPDHFLPGTVDNFVTNEKIVKGLSAKQIWDKLADISQWQTYYRNCTSITPPSSSNWLKQGNIFKFSTFGFPVLTCNVDESVSPSDAKDGAGRIAWSAKLDGSEDEKVEVYHAWLVEDLEGGRVRILTQESQIGKPAAELSAAKPNKMLLGHQDWVDGLVAAAKGEKVNFETTNLNAAGLEAY
jgi:hypothetical protein